MAPTKAKDEAMEKDNSTTVPEAVQDDGWERVKVGLGDAWDFEKNPTLEGRFLGTQIQELKKPGLDGKTEASALTFETSDGRQVFVWSTSELGRAFVDIVGGEVVRITWRGKETFQGEDGPQNINRYDVFRRKPQQQIPYVAPDMPEDL